MISTEYPQFISNCKIRKISIKEDLLSVHKAARADLIKHMLLKCIKHWKSVNGKFCIKYFKMNCLKHFALRVKFLFTFITFV